MSHCIDLALHLSVFYGIPALFVFGLSFICSAVGCWLFACYGRPIFVAKPRDWTPDRHHQTKQGIPTMAGLILVPLWLGLMVFYEFIKYPDYWSLSPALWLIVTMGLLGAYDDWSKIQRTGGIGAWPKFIAQNGAALIAMGLWYWRNPMTTGNLWLPIFDIALPLGVFIILWGAFVIVATNNAINLTDGLDGLAATVLIICFLVIHIVSLGVNMDIIVGSLAAIGIFLGFLCFNWHPARIFMGDTGALAFGALLGLYAVQLNITLLLPLIAIVPVLETASVILQVIWFKLYKTRIFRMAPLHHHFELIGFSEHAIVAGAAAITLIGSLSAFLLI